MPKSPLSDTAHAVLNDARNHLDRLALPPPNLPAAAQRAVVRSLRKAGLLEEVEAGGGQPSWRATGAGLLAIGTGLAPPGGGVKGPTDAVPLASPQPSQRETLHRSAEAVFAAWDDSLANTYPALANAVASLRTALASQRSTRAAFRMPRQPRPDTKRALVLGLLRRPEGTTVTQVADATGWARHTVHGFFAGLKKSGTSVKVLERVCQVGPGKQGGAGSYTVYRAAEAG